MSIEWDPYPTDNVAVAPAATELKRYSIYPVDKNGMPYFDKPSVNWALWDEAQAALDAKQAELAKARDLINNLQADYAEEAVDLREMEEADTVLIRKLVDERFKVHDILKRIRAAYDAMGIDELEALLAEAEAMTK